MGVGKNGIRVLSIKLRIVVSARAYAAPFPTTTRGARADFRSCATLNTTAGSPLGFDGGGISWDSDVGNLKPEEALPWIISAGRSTNDGPGRPYQHVLYPFRTASAMYSTVGGLTASFVCGDRRETASISWNPPFVKVEVSTEPAMTRSGQAFAVALPI
jgi:hypothetical protein